jgi:hypothetical protein
MTSSIPFFLWDLPRPLPPPSSPVREAVADIVARARRKIAINWNKNISLGSLLRSYERTVLYQGAVYVNEGDYVQGYLYLYMFAEYFVPFTRLISRFSISWIKQHPDHNKLQYRAQIQHVQDVFSVRSSSCSFALG